MEHIVAGVHTVADAVKETLGPSGKNVVIQKAYGSPTVTKDGVTVAQAIDLKDPYENMGAQLIKEASSKANDIAGDGSSTTIVLTDAIVTEGMKYLAAGANPVSLQRGINKGAKLIIDALKKFAKPVESDEDLVKVAMVSSNWDKEIGEIVAEAVRTVGKNGTVTVEEARSIDTSLSVVEGMQIDKGYISPYFITDQANMECVLENPYVMVTDSKLSSLREFVNILEMASTDRRALFIVADDVESEALAALVVNKMRGALQVCAVRAPGFGDRRKEMLRDIATVTGGVMLASETGIRFNDVTPDMLGTAKKVVVTKDSAVIIEGAGSKENINERIAMIQKQISESNSEYDIDKYKERVSKLSGGIGVIKVGASTESEMREKKYRVEDALNATKAAAEEGIVPGGGVAFLWANRIKENVDDLQFDELAGAKIVFKAIEAPLTQLIANSGRNAGGILSDITDDNNHNPWYGYNVATGKGCHMLEEGIVDPVKVTRTALDKAASIAGLILTTACIIVDDQDEKKIPHPDMPPVSMNAY